MIDIEKQIITQRYKGELHKGVDLRSWDYENNCLFDIIAPEDLFFLRQGTDGYDNDFIVFENSDKIELKFIHVDIEVFYLLLGDLMIKKGVIGHSQIKGNSTAHHLHFETWKNGNHYNPVFYFKTLKMEWEMA